MTNVLCCLTGDEYVEIRMKADDEEDKDSTAVTINLKSSDTFVILLRKKSGNS